MTRTRTVVAAAVAVMVLAPACGKDEPKPGISGLPVSTTTATTSAPGAAGEAETGEGGDLLQGETSGDSGGHGDDH